jgi:hypothetical protein
MNTRNLCSFVLATCLAACGGTAATGAPPATASDTAHGARTPALDGRSFDVTLESADSQPVKDTLVFQGGRFESTACTSLGFPQWSDYAAGTDGSATTFRGMAKHPSGATMDWNGKVVGDAVEGTALHTTNGKTSTMTFKGSARL